MKKLLLFTLIGAVWLSSCSVPYKAFTYSIDYSSYLRDGFFISESYAVNFDYEPVASVGSEIEPGYLTSKDGSGNKYVNATPEDALAYLIVQSKKIGADAIIGLKINRVYVDKFKPYNYTASGMAVKRKQAIK